MGLAPWQEFLIAHIFCGGKFETIHTRKGGPRLVCTCRHEKEGEQ